MEIHVSQEMFELYLTVLGGITLIFGTMLLVRMLNDSYENRKAKEASAIAQAVKFATLGHRRRWAKGPDADQSQYDTMH